MHYRELIMLKARSELCEGKGCRFSQQLIVDELSETYIRSSTICRLPSSISLCSMKQLVSSFPADLQVNGLWYAKRITEVP
jgi:hypothetical protein